MRRPLAAELQRGVQLLAFLGPMAHADLLDVFLCNSRLEMEGADLHSHAFFLCVVDIIGYPHPTYLGSVLKLTYTHVERRSMDAHYR